MHHYSLEDFSDQSRQKELLALICQGVSTNLEVVYPSDFRSAKLLREVIDNICKVYHIDPKWRTRLVLIIDELNNNAIEYGSKKGENNIFRLIIEKKACGTLSMHASVTDTGNGEEAKSSEDMEFLRKKHQDKDFSSHHSIRGRGLFLIITQLVDRLYFKDSQGGLTVGIKKELTMS